MQPHTIWASSASPLPLPPPDAPKRLFSLSRSRIELKMIHMWLLILQMRDAPMRNSFLHLLITLMKLVSFSTNDCSSYWSQILKPVPSQRSCSWKHYAQWQGIGVPRCEACLLLGYLWVTFRLLFKNCYFIGKDRFPREGISQKASQWFPIPSWLLHMAGTVWSFTRNNNKWFTFHWDNLTYKKMQTALPCSK